MKYAFQIGTKIAEVNFDDSLTIAELGVARDMLVKLVDIRLMELKAKENNKLPLSADIDSMYPELSVRTRNVLKRAGYNTIGDVLGCTITDLQRVRNMGVHSLEEIQTRFSAYGSFKEQMGEDNATD